MWKKSDYCKLRTNEGGGVIVTVALQGWERESKNRPKTELRNIWTTPHREAYYDK